MWRVIKINQDGSMVLILNDVISALTYGSSSKYQDSSLRGYLNTITNQPFTGIFEQTLNDKNQYLKKNLWKKPRYIV